MPGDVVLLTGASGLLGTLLRRAAPWGCELVAVTHRNELRDVPAVRADLRDADQVESAVRQARPSLVIHAAYAKDHASIVDAYAGLGLTFTAMPCTARTRRSIARAVAAISTWRTWAPVSEAGVRARRRSGGSG